MSDAEAFGRKIMDLQRMGRFTLSKMKDGAWHCSIEFPAPDGVTARVESDFKSRDPMGALLQVESHIANLKRVLIEGRTA